MHEIRGNYRVMDSCDLLECGMFDKNSYLHIMNECLSVYRRVDIRGRLNILQETKIWPKKLTECIISVSENIGDEYEEEIKTSLIGSTSISIEDCMKANKYIKEDMQCVDKTMKDGEMIETSFTPPWNVLLSDVSQYGCEGMPVKRSIPSYKNEDDDMRLLWVMMTIPS